MSAIHYKLIFAVLLLFGLRLPLLKSFSSTLMGPVYICFLAIAGTGRDFSRGMADSINQLLNIFSLSTYVFYIAAVLYLFYCIVRLSKGLLKSSGSAERLLGFVSRSLHGGQGLQTPCCTYAECCAPLPLSWVYVYVGLTMEKR